MGLINKKSGEYIKVSHSDEYSNKELYTFSIEGFVSLEHRNSKELREKFHSEQERASEEICKEYTKRLNKLVIGKDETFREAKITAAYASIKAVEPDKWEDSIEYSLRHESRLKQLKNEKQTKYME